MPRLFVALPVPEEIADDLLALQSGVPDARWIAPENFHVTLCFAGEVHGAMMRDFEEELSDIASPRFAVALAGVEQFSSGKQPRALVATVERSDRLQWLQQKVSSISRSIPAGAAAVGGSIPRKRATGCLSKVRSDGMALMLLWTASLRLARNHERARGSRSGRP